jgi:hypothetical protein
VVSNKREQNPHPHMVPSQRERSPHHKRNMSSRSGPIVTELTSSNGPWL